MKIQLDLSKHCIETEIKRHYNRALSDYFKAGKDKGLIEKIIELTQQALKTFDFARLRTKYPPLSGNTNQNIVLSMDNNKFSITIDGRPIEPITKDSVW
ncbi:hypothetical protein ACFL0M_08905 [Thermodesulfobacteriota bacterium]